MVAKLRTASEACFPGYSFDLCKEFPSLAERKFWARCFHDLARAIFLRRIGKQDTDCWQTGTIALCYLIGRLLTQAVREVEDQWYPETEDALLTEAFYGKLTNIKL